MNDSTPLPSPASDTSAPPPAFAPVTPPAVVMDPQRIAAWQQRIDSEQSFMLAILGAAVGAVAGAVAWAAITVLTEYQIGFMAIGVGVLVGFLVRKLGKGMSSVFGVIGAVFALLGCMLGNLLTVCWLAAEQEHQPVLGLLLSLTPEGIVETLKATFDGMDLLFYGIAVWEGYKLSFRQLTEADIAELKA